MQENCLIRRKLRLISKFKMSQTAKQIIALHILHNISISKGKQTMKFGQLVEYNMRNIFLQKSYKNMVERLVPDSFRKNQIWDISGTKI